MAGDAEERKPEGKAVDDDEEKLQHDDAVDKAREEFLGKYRVLFYKLGEVVEARGCTKGVRICGSGAIFEGMVGLYL